MSHGHRNGIVMLLCVILTGCAANGKREQLVTKSEPPCPALEQPIQPVVYRSGSTDANELSPIAANSMDGPPNTIQTVNTGETDADELRNLPSEVDSSNAFYPNTADSHGELGDSHDVGAGRNYQAIRLDDVLNSVADCYPLLEFALAELAEAEGKTLAAWGGFDTLVSGYSYNKSLGFYENYRHGGKVSRPLWNGSEVYGGYRIGRGVFEPWYQERQTNEGGEFKAGIKRPFLKGRAIDGRRAEVQTARLERQRLEPEIATRLLGMQQAACKTYWKWVASGRATQTQKRLLDLAQERNKSLIRQVEEGDLPKITEIDNGRFIAKRQVKLIETQRKVQEAAIKLSLFLRDANCQPLVATDQMLPHQFPTATPIEVEAVDSDIARALAQRPELLDLDVQRRQIEVQLCYAQNQMLPKFDGFAEAGQDVGEPTSAKRDKSELEIEVGVIAELPLQRRVACGKVKAAQAKLVQIAAKRRFAEDKIRSQVLDAVSELNNAYERIQQARENLRLTEQSLRLGQLRFDEGDIDIIALNIYETSLAEAEMLVIDAELAYFSARANYQAALAMES